MDLGDIFEDLAAKRQPMHAEDVYQHRPVGGSEDVGVVQVRSQELKMRTCSEDHTVVLPLRLKRSRSINESVKPVELDTAEKCASIRPACTGKPTIQRPCCYWRMFSPVRSTISTQCPL